MRLLWVPTLCGLHAAPAFAQVVTGAAPPLTPLPEGAGCEISIRTTDETGTILVDGEVRGEGVFEGRFPPGPHTLRVERVGFDPFQNTINCTAGDVHAESVLLRPSVTLAPVPLESAKVEANTDGLYGGIQLLGAFEPTGSGTTLQDACDTTGATSCSAGSVAGGGISGYVGWMLEPLGLELLLLGAGDVVSPSASFDGENGSEINPIVAAPAREERFTIARFGGGAALRARVFTQLSRVRFSFAAGPGLAYRYLVMKRDTETTDGLTGEVADTGTGYVSALLSIELSAQFLLGKSTALSAGLVTWLEHAGSDVQSEPKNRSVLLGEGTAVPQATPAYDMANGTQWFLGPFVGLAFGP